MTDLQPIASAPPARRLVDGPTVPRGVGRVVRPDHGFPPRRSTERLADGPPMEARAEPLRAWDDRPVDKEPRMKAAVVHDFTRPLEIEEVPTPEPGAEQVLVRIEASGLCHTDIHAARGEWPVKPSPPFIPGHEGVGIVERVGAGQRARHRRGHARRAALARLRLRRLRYCNTGRETLCESQLNMGYAMNGGFAEYAVGYARHVVARARRHRPARRGAADLRRRHDLQGGQGLRRALVGPRRRVRRRRPRPPGDPVRRASRAPRSSPSTSTPSALESGPRARRRARRARRRGGPGRRDPAPRRRPTRRSRPR